MSRTIIERNLFAIAIVIGVSFLAIVLFLGPPILTIAYLWNLPRGDTHAVPYATKKLKSNVTLTRVAAARGLGSIGPSAEPAVPDLINVLKDKSPSVASSSAWALGAIQSPRPEAINALIDALGSRDGEVRRYAAYALSQCQQLLVAPNAF